ncbi:hypothetical protein GKQ77_25435 [Streptomyces sp. BG9H]|uniref:Uncharacterized protein n=1 Tax=Streptomyces anatolicus TaxID=2675858 RepID=A0ABS6YTU6_9ACTN|nr:hypothetical protein [Streptomyces anatolicus]MBW5424870.1 hypothetical protein [Streptomyces anatolicus]
MTVPVVVAMPGRVAVATPVPAVVLMPEPAVAVLLMPEAVAPAVRGPAAPAMPEPAAVGSKDPVVAALADPAVVAVVDSVWADLLCAMFIVLFPSPWARAPALAVVTAWCHAPASRGTACQMGRVVRKLGHRDTPGLPSGFAAR